MYQQQTKLTMKTIFLKFITVASFQVGVNVIGLPETFNLQKPVFTSVKSKYRN